MLTLSLSHGITKSIHVIEQKLIRSLRGYKIFQIFTGGSFLGFSYGQFSLIFFIVSLFLKKQNLYPDGDMWNKKNFSSSTWISHYPNIYGSGKNDGTQHILMVVMILGGWIFSLHVELVSQFVSCCATRVVLSWSWKREKKKREKLSRWICIIKKKKFFNIENTEFSHAIHFAALLF